MDIFCSKCKKIIGRKDFNKIHPSEIEVIDIGMLLYPEIKMCEDCYFEIADPYKVHRRKPCKKQTV